MSFAEELKAVLGLLVFLSLPVLWCLLSSFLNLPPRRRGRKHDVSIF